VEVALLDSRRALRCRWPYLGVEPAAVASRGVGGQKGVKAGQWLWVFLPGFAVERTNGEETLPALLGVSPLPWSQKNLRCSTAQSRQEAC